VLLRASGPWTAQPNAPFLHIAAASSTGSGKALVAFSIDAFNATGSRVGTLTIDGMTLTVTQAGTNYTLSADPVTAANLGMSPSSAAVDSAGNLYFDGDITQLNCSSTGGNCTTSITDGLLQKVSASNKAVTTLGSGLKSPAMMAVDSAGNVYVADSGNNAIKQWNVATQQFTTLISGLSDPRGVAVDSAGNLYIADTGNHAIKKWTAATQQLTTLLSGLSYVPGVAVDLTGVVYFTESNTAPSPYVNISVYGKIMQWDPSTQQVTIVVSGLNNPEGVVVDGSDNLYFMDEATFDVEPHYVAGSGPARPSRSAGCRALNLSMRVPDSPWTVASLSMLPATCT
jgi:sugar lactone lactonase YvrE